MAFRPAIHQAVAGSGIETDRSIVRRQPGNVADAADVLNRAADALVAEQQGVRPTCQRRALSAGRDITRAEVADRGHSEPLDDNRRLGDLKR